MEENDITKALESAEKITKELRILLSDLFGPTAEELGHLIGDKIRFVRFKNCVSMVKKAKQLLQEAGINVRVVKPAIMLPILDGCSLESEDDLIEKWAGLLATACSASDVHKSFPKILSELGSVEVKILDSLFNWYEAKKIPRHEWSRKGLTKSEITTELNIDSESFELSLDNLFRLNLCQPPGNSAISILNDKTDRRLNAIASRTYEGASLTVLGFEFTKACRGPIK